MIMVTLIRAFCLNSIAYVGSEPYRNAPTHR
jgi:hypothetical protein